MATAKERENFLLAMAREGVPADVARLVMRHAATYQRLQEAQCNGDFPADNGERPTRTCGTCGISWHPSAYRKCGPFRVTCSQCGYRDPLSFTLRHHAEERTTAVHVFTNGTHRAPTHAFDGLQVVTDARCPDCRTADRLRAILAPFNIVPDLSGDPRGAVVKLKVPSGRTDDWGQTGICVP